MGFNPSGVTFNWENAFQFSFILNTEMAKYLKFYDIGKL